MHHTDSTIRLKLPLTNDELEAGGRKPRISSCGHKDECAKMKEAWCASQTKLRWMANQLLTIQENERKRIATDLHDGLGQSLNMIKFALTETEKLLAAGAVSEASASLQRLKQNVHGVLDEARQISMDLRPPMLDDIGLLATLSWFCRELETTCPAIKVEKDINVLESHVPDQLKITIFRIAQEASSNIVKYAKANRIRITLRKADDVLHFTIEDNGVGFDPEGVAIRTGSDRGLGLLSMKERAGLSGGSYSMKSVQGEGTRIQVSWRFDESAEI